MDPTLAFMLRATACAALAWIWFSIPGVLAARAVRLPSETRPLFAPLLGAAVFGTTSCLLFQLVPYNRVSLLAAYALCNLGLLAWCRRAGAGGNPSRRAWWMLLASFPIGICAIPDIVPVVHQGGLYLGAAINDHAKMAIVDAIAREGLPPVTPYYHPGREVPLNYYYLWHFLASQPRVLAGFSGWEADAALTWLTLSSAGALVAGLVLALGGGALGALCGVLLLLGGGVRHAILKASSSLSGGSPVDWLAPYVALRPGIQSVIVNAAWAPQHVFAAAQAALLVYLLAHALSRRDAALGPALMLAVAGAALFGSSLWLAAALAVAAPAVALALARSERRRTGVDGRSASPARVLLVATVLLVVLCAPVLWAELRVGPTSGAREEAEEAALPAIPVTVEQHRLWPARPAWVNVVGWWLIAMPGVYGAALVLGAAGWILHRPATDDDRLFRAAAGAAIPAFLLVASCLRSTVSTNDLGWRSHVPSYLLLCAFGGVLVSALGRRGPAPAMPAVARLRPPTRRALATLAALGVAVGLYGAPFEALYKTYVVRRPSARWTEAQGEIRRDLLEQERAWRIVRELVGPEGVVQSNPDGYAEVTPWPINLPYVLFADRKAAAATEPTPFTFSSRSDAAERERTIALVRAAFRGHPDPRVYGALRVVLGIDAMLVDRRDPLFHVDRLESSGAWRLAHGERGFKIYVAAGAAGSRPSG